MAQQRIAALNDRDLVLCDFDGTVSAEDTGLLVARELRLERFFEIEERWRRGEISSRECLRDQWRTVDPSRADFRELIANLEVNPGFEELVALTGVRGARLVILSDGLDYYIRMTLERLGLERLEYRANHAVLHEHHVELQFPCPADACDFCGNCKTLWLFELRPGFERLIYLGDGISDGCASRYCDVVFAKDLLAGICRERGQEFVPFETLEDVVPVLRDGSVLRAR
ncbi:MAG: HAD-IB family phosphatase [Armatimonadetes bacterium]|nr:HAD-IB family phosphatase [Armatimonadota bacterium]